MKKAVIMCFLVVLVCCNSCIADESIFQIYAYENGSAIFVSFDGKMGLITQSGEIIVPAMFDDIDVFDENGIAITTKINGNECFYGLLNQKGEIIVENCFTHLSRRRHSELGYSSKYGVYYAENQTGEGYAIFSDGTMIKYPEISFSSETNYLSTLNTSSFFVNKTVFLRINEGWMLFGVNGSPIVNEVWEDYIPFPTGGGAVKKNGLWGIVNQNGLLIVDYQYTGRPQYTPCGIVAGKQEARTGDTLWGMISYDGKEVLPFSFNSISTISENRIAVSVDGKYGYLNSNFQWVILPQWEYASDFHNQIAYVRFEDKVCLINENGKVIISFDDYFGKTIYWSRYIAAYDQYKRTITLFDRDGQITMILENMVIPSESVETEGMLCIGKIDGEEVKYGYIDLKTGRIEIEPNFDKANNFEDGLAIVCTGARLFGVIDIRGNYVIEPKYTLLIRREDVSGIWFEAEKETDTTFDCFVFDSEGELVKYTHSNTPTNG